MTPEQAFEKWWNDQDCLQSDPLHIFLAGQQYQELLQIGVLADIRKAVGDPEGRLMWEELVKRIEGLVSPWRDIESAPKDGTEILGWRHDCGVFTVRFCSAEDFLTSSEMEGWSDRRRERFDWFCADFAHGDRLEGDLIPTHWMPLPAGPVESVMTEKEEAA